MTFRVISISAFPPAQATADRDGYTASALRWDLGFRGSEFIGFRLPWSLRNLCPKAWNPKASVPSQPLQGMSRSLYGLGRVYIGLWKFDSTQTGLSTGRCRVLRLHYFSTLELWPHPNLKTSNPTSSTNHKLRSKPLNPAPETLNDPKCGNQYIQDHFFSRRRHRTLQGFGLPGTEDRMQINREGETVRQLEEGIWVY